MKIRAGTYASHRWKARDCPARVPLGPRPAHVNLGAKSEGLLRPEAMSYLRWGIQAVETELHLYTTNLQSARPEQTKRRRRAYRTHTEEERLVAKRENKTNPTNKTEVHRMCETDKSLTDWKTKRYLQPVMAQAPRWLVSLRKGQSTVKGNKEGVMYIAINI